MTVAALPPCITGKQSPCLCLHLNALLDEVIKQKYRLLYAHKNDLLLFVYINYNQQLSFKYKKPKS